MALVGLTLLLSASAAYHPGVVPRLAYRRSSIIRSAAGALPIEEAPTKVLYDGQCMVCLTNKAILTWFDRRKGRLDFVNIRDESYSPAANGGIAFEDAMRHFHTITEGTVAEGSEAVLTAYSKVGLGWVMAVLRFPLIRWFIDGIYAIVSKHRYTISKFLPGGAKLADAVTQIKDVSTASMGGGCDDEEECMLDYDDDDDDDE